MAQIDPDIHICSGLISNCYFITRPAGITLIDCGLTLDYRKILRLLIRLGYPEKPLQRILITHADGDHYGSAARLQKITSARVASSPVEKEAIEKGGSSRPLKGSRLMTLAANLVKPLFAAPAFTVDDTLMEGKAIPGLEFLKVLETPGHTPGHLSYWLEEAGILFAGDSIWEKGARPVASSGINTWDMELAKSSYDRQMQLNPRLLCAGHTCMKLR